MKAIDDFYYLCSQIMDPSIRMALESWAARYVKTYSVETRLDPDASDPKYLKYYQEKQLAEMISGVIEKASIEERKPWMQGDLKFGSIVRKSVSVLVELP